MAAFGQTEFDQYHIWPNLTGRIWPDRIWPIFFGVGWWGVRCGGAVGVLLGCWVGRAVGGLGLRKARRVGGPKFRAFLISPAAKFVLFFPLWGSSAEFWWCLKRRGAQMCAFGVLWLSYEAPAAPKPPGFHTTTREPKLELASNSNTLVGVKLVNSSGRGSRGNAGLRGWSLRTSKVA